MASQSTYSIIRQLHQLLDQTFLDGLVRLRRDHVSDCLVEGVDLSIAEEITQNTVRTASRQANIEDIPVAAKDPG